MQQAQQQAQAQAQAQAQQQQAQLVQALLAQAGMAGGPKRPGPPKPKKRVAQPLHLVPESPAITAAGDHDRRLDLLLRRRRIEVQVATAHEQPARKKVRMYVTHRHAHQPGAGGAQGGGGEPPQWSLHISGRADPDTPADPLAAALAALQQSGQSGPGAQAAAVAAAAAASRQGGAFPFTSLWRRVTLTLRYRREAAAAAAAAQEQPRTRRASQQQQQAGGGDEFDEEEVVVWEKSRHRGPHREELQLMRAGSAPVRATIRLEPDNTPPRFRLPPALAQAVGTAYDTRKGASLAVERQLPPGKPGKLVLTPQIAAALGQPAGAEVARGDVIGLVANVLEPMEPVVITHDIDFSSPPPCGARHCYEFTLDMPTKMAERAHPALEAMAAQMERELEEHDKELAAALGVLQEARRRRNLLLGFSQEPAAFIDGLVAAQARDLRAATGAGSVVNGRQVFETPRRSDAFSAGWVEEAVLKHLLRKKTEHAAAGAQAHMAAAQLQMQEQARLQQLLLQQQAGGGGLGQLGGGLQAVPMQAAMLQGAGQQAQQPPQGM
ncbi:MAG: hypothetical protein J3K34DRAFT_221002 [Monoraphidium minutum]|nr:MAG: hypothetical protein J3K34DRAFT_221002 [Monoraphidium minutum]